MKKKETDDNLKKLKVVMASTVNENSRLKNEVDNLILLVNEIKKGTDDNFKNLKLEMTSSVNELKKDNNDKLNSLKNENSRSKNEVDNLILLVNEIKKGTDDNFKNLKLEMTSSVNELKKEMVSSFKKLNPFSFVPPYGIQNNVHVSKLTVS